MTFYEIRHVSSAADAASDPNFQTVCDYLRVDQGDDDTMVWKCICSAYDYILAAVGEVDEDDATVTLLLCAITQDLYDHRELTQSEQQLKLRQGQTYQTIILQLQMKHSLSEEESS